MNELSSTAVSNNQPSVREIRQRGDQRDDQRGEREERVEGVPKVMTSVFQV